MAFAQEVAAGERFAFGKNWSSYLRLIDEDRIAAAERSLSVVAPLVGKRFVDVGSGSGLFSLAARRLGASVVSFDYDPDSVRCTAKLKAKYFPEDSSWTVEQGSALDREFLQGLGTFDVVYSWGVLHHTGAMHVALENVAALARPGGRLFISIYNDQGGASRRWRLVKRTYNACGNTGRALIAGGVAAFWAGRGAAIDLVRGQNPFARQEEHRRGMNWWRDVIDWVGGYPFEVAKPEEIFDFFRERGFRLDHIRTCAGGHGCNEYAFTADMLARTSRGER